jgi:hypothetical protein
MAEPEGAARRRGGRRPDWEAHFLELLKGTGNATLAAQGAGIDRTTAYARAARDPAFAAAWRAAQEAAIDLLEGAARQRALAGSDQLLMFLLRGLRPERYGARLDLHVELRREAERVAERLGCSVEEVLAAAERTAREVLAP